MAGMATLADIVVVGLGAVGSAALYQSAKLGASVIGIDRFCPPHDQGSSHGETRITRQAIGEGREFVPLVLRSNEIWDELEAVSGRDLITRNGGLILASPNIVGKHHGSNSFLKETIDAARAFGIAAPAAQCRRNSRNLPAVSAHLGRAGLLRARRRFSAAGSVHRDANRPGEEVGRESVYVRNCLGIEARRRKRQDRHRQRHVLGRQSHTHCGTLDCQISRPRSSPGISLSIGRRCAGLHSAKTSSAIRRNIFLFSSGLPATACKTCFTVSRPSTGLAAGSKSPRRVTKIKWTLTRFRVKLAKHPRRRCIRSTSRLGSLTSALSACVQRRVSTPVTPDAKFVIDYADTDQHVLFASACSGHGFKHSAAVGEALAQRALELPTRVDMSGFALKDWRAQDPHNA